MTFSQVLFPLSVILIVGPLLLVCAVEDTLTVTDISSIDKHFTFVMITVAVGVSGHNSVPRVRRAVLGMIGIAISSGVGEVCRLVVTTILEVFSSANVLLI